MTWQDQIKNSIRNVERLEELVSLSPQEKETIRKVIRKYPMRITPHYAGLIDWSNPEDPLRRKVVPSVNEIRKINVEDSDDSYGEEENTVFPGLEHKYDPMALMLVADTCAGYCRECFRKAFVSDSQEDFEREVLTPNNYQKAVDYIKKHPGIDDILVTGGEPLLLSTPNLDNLLSKLIEAPNVKKIRIGTKIPAYLPQRILEDDGLIEVLKRYIDKVELRMVVNYNHPRELTEESKESLRKLKSIGIRLYNQTPLLKGVNDDPGVLRKLLVDLDNAGVIPYYVFERMTQKGTAHLSVPTKEGFRIFEEATYGLEGTAQTAKYVIPRKEGKLQVLDVYERDGKTFARAKYLKTRRGYQGERSFEMKV